MMATLVLELPLAWQLGVPAAAGLLVLSWFGFRRQGVSRGRGAGLLACRGVVLAVLVVLLARPVWIGREEDEAQATRTVALLVDRSESMSLPDAAPTRYQAGLRLARDQLLPVLKRAGWHVQPILFADDARPADGPQWAAARPDGPRTDLGRAIAHALVGTVPAPRAVIALTDGAANESGENARALAALVETGAPFIGIGFGSDQGVQSLALKQVDAPPMVAPKQVFQVAVRLELRNAPELPAFDLVLLRDGKMVERKTVTAGKGSRTWLENFRVEEPSEGVRQYTVQLLPPAAPGLTCVATLGSTSVRVSGEKELRVLFVQGALTWDFKFISLGLRGDPSIKLTGLTRTSSHSVFRQNVEAAGELLGGFPANLDEMAPFRVVVLSNLGPADLSLTQQEVLARFCGELGGGVLMIGGPATFNPSWQGSRLEQLLPVVFAGERGVQGLDRPFHLQLTDEALRQPVFQVSDGAANRAVWEQLPTFTEYGRVETVKPGAQIWGVHETDSGPHGRRVLLAAQRFGAGLSAIIGVQNFWRWRLAKESDPQGFDRFWRQLFRWLGQSSRAEVNIHFADQELRPGSDVEMVLEEMPDPHQVGPAARAYQVRVEHESKQVVHQQRLELAPGRPVADRFRAEKPGGYTVTVLNAQNVPAAVRSVTVPALGLEFAQTARNMELLRQWASVSGGLALKAEECYGLDDLLRRLQAKLEQAARRRTLRRPVGVNGWTLGLVAGCLCLEYGLRRRWELR